MSAPTVRTMCIFLTARSGFLIPPKKKSFSFSFLAFFDACCCEGPRSLATSPACQALFDPTTCMLSVTGLGVLASRLLTQFFWSWLNSIAFVWHLYLQNSSCRFCLNTLMTSAAYFLARVMGYSAAAAVLVLPSSVTCDTQEGHWHFPLRPSRPCSLPAQRAGFHHRCFPSIWMQLLKFATWASYCFRNSCSSANSQEGRSGPVSDPGGFSSVATSPTLRLRWLSSTLAAMMADLTARMVPVSASLCWLASLDGSP